MKNSISFSVVIPTLNNRRKYLKEAINSIEKQTLLPLEVIIVNNGKNNLEINKSSLNIRHFKIAFKSGVAKARNFGASLAKSNYIAFLDDDDLWGIDYFENMKTAIKKSKPDCLIGRLDQYVNNKIKPFKNAQGNITKDIILIRNPGITGSSIVIKKNIFQKIGGFNTKLPTGEDKSLILELIKKKFKIIAVPNSQAIIRQSDTERLSNSQNMYNGISQFYKVYNDQMNLSHKINNLYKINKYLWRFKKSISAALLYNFFFILVTLDRIIKKFFKLK